MKPFTLFITALLFTHLIFGQIHDAWIRFYDKSTELSGYKDLRGNIKLPAKFDGFTRADTFHNIIAVNERAGSSYRSYYLLKDGREVGRDSVFVFDATFDCESEGKIIFRDRKKDRVGFLDRNGTAVIPALYNYVLPFRNGIAIAHQNARRKCWDEAGDTTKCEHLGWEGGETILINERNEILADSLNIDSLISLNWYSKKINDPYIDTSIYIDIKGKDGATYSFVNYDKEFTKWFYNMFVQALDDHNRLQDLLFDEVTFWSRSQGRRSLSKKNFLKSFPTALSAKRFELSNMKELFIGQDLFNEMIFKKLIYRRYLNSCGEHNKERYPFYNVRLTYNKHTQKPVAADSAKDVDGFIEADYQEDFNFLRTENGYRLLSISTIR